MNRFYIIIILFLNLIKLLFVFYLIYTLIKKKSLIGSFIILFFITINILLYGISVNIFRFISDSNIFKDYNVKPLEVFYVELVEFFSFLLFLTICYFIFINKRLNKFYYNIPNFNNVFIILSFINVFCIINYFISDYYNTFIFGEVFKYLSGPSAVILTFYSFYHKRYKFLIISLLHLGLVLFLVFSTGVRGPIVGIILIILFLYIKHYPLKKVLRKIPLLVIPILLLIFLNKEYSKLKTAFTTEYISNPQGYQSILDIGSFVIDFYKNGGSEYVEGNESKSYDEIEFRLGARSMYSVGFFRFTENTGYTNFKPLINTLYVLFPRAYFNLDKPYPDSYNGEEYGMGMYVCVDEVDHKVYMTDFYASSHYYWQFGIFGVIFFTLLSTIYIFIILYISRKMHYIMQILFIIFSLKPYYFIPQFTISDIILMLITKILPFLVLYFLLNNIYKFKFK